MQSNRLFVSVLLGLATTGLFAQENPVTVPEPASTTAVVAVPDASVAPAPVPVVAPAPVAVAPAPTAAPAFAPAVKKGFSWGGDVRLRYEGYSNAQTLSSSAAFNDRNYFRLRLRSWGTYNVSPELGFFGRVSAEPRYWFHAGSIAAEGNEWKYALVDNLNANWKTNASGMPLTVVVGRQDIQLGDQWLVSDGTPIDGSWTNHFDALRVSLEAKDIKTKFDVIALNQQARPGDRLPILGRKGSYALTEQDETGVILYASNKSLKDTQLDGYLIYKGDKKVTSAGDNTDIYTFGAKASGTPATHWQYSAEGALQWGNRELAVTNPAITTVSRDVLAYGLNTKLTYLFKDALSNQVSLIGEYLSGDKPGSTDKDEMFDVLWGRYPRVGETWAAAYATETSGRSSQYNNLIRLGATWSIAPTKTSSIAATYCALFAPQAVATRATNTARFSGDGHFRGHMFQVVAKQKFTSSLSGLLFAEVCPLGNYYTNRDMITFVRAEVLFSF